jgi:AcrR family transcriptional regulator
MRQDVRRNIDALLSAAAELVGEGEELNMPDIAKRAGVAASTAWRHFSSIAELRRAYTLEKLKELQAKVADAEPGAAVELGSAGLLHRTLEHWVSIVLAGSPALIEFRSRRGYLERLHDEDEIIVMAGAIWRPAIEQVLDETGTSRAATEIALQLANALTDPREIRDLHESAYLGAEEIVRKMDNVIRGAISGWATR